MVGGEIGPGVATVKFLWASLGKKRMCNCRCFIGSLRSLIIVLTKIKQDRNSRSIQFNIGQIFYARRVSIDVTVASVLLDPYFRKATHANAQLIVAECIYSKEELRELTITR